MNILFTCVGRRVELVQCFKAAASELNIDLNVIGADSVLDAPALYFCDKKVQVPKIKENNYISELLRICKEEKVEALIPTIDTDLLTLSAHSICFDEIGTKVFISAEDKIKICRDKRLTAEYLEGLGLSSPKTFDDAKSYNLGFPAFIKPLDGSSSIFAYKLKSQTELDAFAQVVPDYIIQPCVEGTEYTVDAFCDYEGNPIYITPRIRLAVRSGEVLKTQIVQDQKIINEMKVLLADFRPVGAITVQLIRDAEGNDHYIEINPRYGGGAPLSIKAGANSPKALLRLVAGEKLSYEDGAAEDGAVYSRFDQAVKVK